MKMAGLVVTLAVAGFAGTAAAQQQELVHPHPPTPPPILPHKPPTPINPPEHASPSQPSLPSAEMPSVTVSPPPADMPGLRPVPSVASLPSMRNRPIVRHVHVSGVALDVPAIVIVGAPYIIDVPGLGWVYVPEDEYPALFAMLTSEDPVQVEAGYALLHQYADQED